MKLPTFPIILATILCGTLNANGASDDQALGMLYIQSKLGMAGIEECSASFPENQEKYEKTYAKWLNKNQSRVDMGYEYLVKQSAIEGQNIDEVVEQESQNTKLAISMLEEPEKLKRCELVLQVFKN